MWSEEETNELYETWARGPGDHHRVDSLKAVATRAVELVRARGGTMTAEELESWLRPLEIQMGRPWTADAIRQHHAAQGARVAQLEADLETAREDVATNQRVIAEEVQKRMNAEAEVERLKAELDGLYGRFRERTQERDEYRQKWDDRGAKLIAALDRAEAAESILAAILKRAETYGPGTLDVPISRPEPEEHAFVPHRMGDDVCQEPGDFAHSICGRPRASHRHRCSHTRTHDDAANPGHPGRVRERSEAMRAACWEAVQEQLRACGFTEGMQAWRDFKAVIEGATP